MKTESHIFFKRKLQNLRIKHHSELKADDWQFLRENGIINGCGGNIRNDCGNIFTKILAKISEKIAKKLRPVFFEASCDLHDFGYWQGGDEERRKECDRKFYLALLRDIDLYFSLQISASPLREHEPFKARSYKRKIQLFRKNHGQDYEKILADIENEYRGNF